VLGLDITASDVHFRGNHLRNAEVVERGHGADDVDQSVERAELV
jgi:hypothetical protein